MTNRATVVGDCDRWRTARRAARIAAGTGHLSDHRDRHSDDVAPEDAVSVSRPLCAVLAILHRDDEIVDRISFRS